MNKGQRLVSTVPFLGILLIAVVVCAYLADLAAVIGWILHLFEVHSIYDRLLPHWTAWDYLLASLVATATAKVLAKALPDY